MSILIENGKTLDKESEGLFFELIEKIAGVTMFDISHLELIFSYIKKLSFYHGHKQTYKKYHPIIPLTITQLLKNLLSKHYKKFDSSLPINYYVFDQSPENYIDVCGPSTKDNKDNRIKWFYGGFCLFAWIYLTKSDKDKIDGYPMQVLFEAEIEKYGKVKVIFEQNRLNYIIEFAGMNERKTVSSYYEPNSIYIAQIPWNTWCFIGLNHQRKLYKKSILTITLNDEFERVFQLDYPKLPDGLFMSRMEIGRNFKGRINSLGIWENPVESKRIMEWFKNFSGGVNQTVDYIPF